jgi:predicted metalloprotease with PDZ domain
VQKPGRMTLMYPEWDAGSHGPTIQVQRVAGLVIKGNEQRLAWQRDPLNAHAFHLDVPAGIRELAVEFLYLAPLGARSPVGPDMINLQWPNFILYPAGFFASRIRVAPSVTLPEGLTLGTSLAQERRTGATTSFAPVPLDLLLDSPVLAARHVQRRDLTTGQVPVQVTYFSGKAEELAGAEAMDAPLRAVIAQTAAVFGPAPFAHFDYLVPLTNQLPGPGGLEHAHSAEIVMPSDFLRDRASYGSSIDLFAHEYVHAWNGKFAQPKGHWTPTPNVPMKSSLLWVYEGQAEFWGRIIAARAGLRSFGDTLDALALDAAAMANRPGRAWKSLADSSLDSITMPGGVGVIWNDWQRRKDYYAEGVLLWLDIDGILRERSKGRYGMDDLAARLFAVQGQAAKQYTEGDIQALLSQLAPFDWRGYLAQRVHGNSDAGLLDGLERAGYRLVYTAAPSLYVQRALQGEGVPDFSYSIGIEINDKGILRAVSWHGPAFDAGLVPGERMVEVEGQPFSAQRLAAAIAARNPVGIKLVMQTDQGRQSITVRYDGGLRYPTLERIADKPDLLKQLLRPLNK